jgi:phospholipid/cholesterol/gamma-HCH transport system ATP-binding protein
MIEVRNLHKTLGPIAVLRGVNLDIRTGESIVIIGRSGSGKSVFLKHLIGLMLPDEGSVAVDGTDITLLDEEQRRRMRRRFGMLFQGSALFDSMSVDENVGLGLREHTKLPESEIKSKVRERLALVGLEGIEEMRPANLSGGMKKRVALARAIAVDPEYVLYDEPTTGLDPITADSINDLIRGLQDRLRVTSVVVTHDMASAFKVGDRIAMLHEGRIIFEGTPEEVQRTEHPVIQQFIHGEAEAPGAAGRHSGSLKKPPQMGGRRPEP